MSEQELVSCPYNPTHRFVESKFMFHLMRCKDGKKLQHLFARCPYNSIHIVKKDQMETHELICPDKDMHEKLKQQMEATSRASLFTRKEEYEDDRSRGANRSRSRSRSRNRIRRSRSRSRSEHHRRRDQRRMKDESQGEQLRLRAGYLHKAEQAQDEQGQMREEIEQLIVLQQCLDCKQLLTHYLSQHQDPQDPIRLLLKQINQLSEQ